MSIFKHSFDTLEGEGLEKVKGYFNACECHTATCTFLANYTWRDNYDLRYEEIGPFLCVSGQVKGDAESKPIMLLPMAKDGSWSDAAYREVILTCKERFAAEGRKLYIVSMSAEEKTFLESIFPDQMKFDHDEDLDEYVYLKEKLITLSGRALHKKKNHMNYFLKTYDYIVKDVTPDMTEEVMAFVTSHKIEKDAEGEELDSLHVEEDAIRRYLAHTNEENVYSAAIYVEGQLAAVALGERLNHETAAEHFEKADDDYRGLYQVICSEFCKRLPEDIVYVNREEDMGLENLRKAKEALRPAYKEAKYWGCFL